MKLQQTILAALAASSISQAATVSSLDFVTNRPYAGLPSYTFNQVTDGQNVSATLTAYMPVVTGTALLGGAAQGMGVYDSSFTNYASEIGTHGGEGGANYNKLEFIDVVFNQTVILTAPTFYTQWGQTSNDFAFTIGDGSGATFSATGSTAQYPSNTNTWFSSIPGYGPQTAIDGTIVNGIRLEAGKTLRIGGGFLGANPASDVPIQSLSYAVVPEPSIAILSSLGALALLRRRRA